MSEDNPMAGHTGYSLMAKDKCIALVDRLNDESDDGSTYKAKHSQKPDGLSFIECFDDYGDYIGRL